MFIIHRIKIGDFSLRSNVKQGKFENVKAPLKDRVRKQKRKSVQERKVYNPSVCSVCKKEGMVRILDFDFRGPPATILQTLSKQTKKVNENTDPKRLPRGRFGTALTKPKLI
ncbi:MAG: hypothetical protein ACK4WD_05735 [Flavobacteriales bacterium]|jgi:hypothetical protein